MLIIGIDGATWDVILPNLEELPTFKKLKETWNCSTMHLKQKPWSASVWCSLFSGKLPEEHNHLDFVKEGVLQTREHIKVNFIWDLLDKQGISVKALNIPFIVPPYNFNLTFQGPGGGVPITLEECSEEIRTVTEKAKEILSIAKPELFIVVYTATDKISHSHWGDPLLLEIYKQVDSSLAELIDKDKEVLILSDHGFCNYDNAPVQTLPKITRDGKELKGDHHPDAIIIKKNVNFEITQPIDLFEGLKKKYEI